jgi:hypothetical protein
MPTVAFEFSIQYNNKLDFLHIFLLKFSKKHCNSNKSMIEYEQQSTGGYYEKDNFPASGRGNA